MDFTPEGKRILITQLSHASGQWMRSFIVMPQDKETPQGVGGAITYSKRYALAALLAIPSDEDDDAEEAEKPYRSSDSNNTNGKPVEKSGPLMTKEQLGQIRAAANGNNELLYNVRQLHKKGSIEEIPQSEFSNIILYLKAKTGALPAYEAAVS
jgi:ERF superfamily